MTESFPSLPDPGERSSRIEILSSELADQIAAGEVVERPASVVKELVDNAIDAGASRIEVELEGAGVRRIVVRDDGHGIHPEDLPLAVMRHATSKLKRPSDLIDVRTLGFRGEALASIAAVCILSVQSRTGDAKVGTHLRSRPGLPPTIEPIGMPYGTSISVEELFINVPARRKFLRAPATEVGHCVDAILKIALVHPQVHVRLSQDGRRLIDLPQASLHDRIAAVLERRGAAPSHDVEQTHEDVQVRAWLAPPDAAVRGRSGIWIVVRRRVVQDRSVQRIVQAAYGERVPSGRSPVACVWIEPPPGSVDVNVHPQKAEVRFSDPQRVYAALRAALGEVETAWGPGAQPREVATHLRPSPAMTRASAAIEAWASSPYRPEPTTQTYRLHTRAASSQYGRARDAFRSEVEQLKARLEPPAQPAATTPPPPDPRLRLDTGIERARFERASERSAPLESIPAFEWLTCLPGPVALVRRRDVVLAVDLHALRSHLVYRRLRSELGGSGRISSQMLLEPVVLERRPGEVELWREHQALVERLGIMAEPFAEDALIVRGVPASVQACVETPDVRDLVERVTPWLEMQARRAPGEEQTLLAQLSQTRGTDPAPRLAKRWIRELIDEGAALEEVPSVVVWDARALLAPRKDQA